MLTLAFMDGPSGTEGPSIKASLMGNCVVSGGAMDVKACHITYRYGQKKVLDDVSYTFGCGLYGLLGVNGAGKTTLLKLLATIMRPESGSLSIDGDEALSRRGRKRARTHIGYLPQCFDLLEASTVLHNVQYAAWLHGGSWRDAGRQAYEALELVGLHERAQSLVKGLSGGMRQRLGIACAMVPFPGLLLLDEPSVGLDPLQRIRLREVLHGYARNNTVILSTHLVDDVVAMADHILVLDRGSLIFDGDADDLAAMGENAEEMTTIWESGYRRLLAGRISEDAEAAEMYGDWL